MRRPWLRLVLLLLALASPLPAGVEYLESVKPLLRDRCYTCHGALKQKARLRLDTVELMLKGGKTGSVVVSGKPDESLILQRVTATRVEDRMPPEHEGEPFTAAQVNLLREWIASGAQAPLNEKAETDPREHFAYRPLLRPQVPAVSGARWIRNPLDAFLARQHEELGLTPQLEAPRAVLLRRLQLDLIGLPPTLDEITAFESDESPEWYEHAVVRLLEDPRHGERWARHWMDIWRYSDWWGLGAELRNSQQHIWHWRDWIVESLNSDLPYDEMVRQMLAADELYPNEPQKLRATGFLARNWFLFNRNSWMEETVEHVSKGFLGLTLNCAKCHDHKYDPFTQVDYYRMRAFFEPYQVRMDVVPGESDLARDGLPRAFDGLLDAPTYRFVRGEERQPDKSTLIAPGVPDVLAFKDLSIQPVALPVEAWQPERRPWVLEAHIASAHRKVEDAEKAAASARAKLASSPAAGSDARAEMNVAELALNVSTAELLSTECRCAAMRAAWAGEANESSPAIIAMRRDATSAAIHAEREANAARARHALADVELRLSRAATDKKPDLEKELKAARESLDRASKELLAPLAAADKFTPLRGAKWMATRFMSSTQDDPSVAFGSVSSGRRAALASWITDARNPLTARVAVNHLWARHLGKPLVANVFDFGRRSAAPTNPELLDWLACELVDHGWSLKHLHWLLVTSSAYRMSSSVAGRDSNLARDPENSRWWRREPIRIEAEVVRDSILSLAGALDLTLGGPPVPAASQGDSRRRSLYFFHSNNERNLFLTAFDEAGVKECYRRDQSIVPQQALALSNSGLVQDCARLIAARLAKDAPRVDDIGMIRRSFRAVLGSPPGDAELAACLKTLEAWRKLPGATPEQAFSNLLWALLNHNDFITLR